jgi:hypothetical protein
MPLLSLVNSTVHNLVSALPLTLLDMLVLAYDEDEHATSQHARAQ